MDPNRFVDQLFSSLGEWFPSVSAEFVHELDEREAQQTKAAQPELEHA